MKRLDAAIGWIGKGLVFLSLFLFVYSGSSLTHATTLQDATMAMSEQPMPVHMSHQQSHSCPNCDANLDDHQMQCGAKLLALSSNMARYKPIISSCIPTQRNRDVIAQIFTPDPPPPRVV